MDTTSSQLLFPQFDFKPKDTVIMLDVGDFKAPIPAAQRRTVRTIAPKSSENNAAFTLMGAPHELGADVQPLSLDLQTFRAFKGDQGVVEAWNQDMVSLMKRPDQEKRGELKIGVALPSAVESILGEGGAGLKVSGHRQISFSGRSQWTDNTSTSSVRQSKFPSLTMDQISSFTVEGTVGSKVFVKVDQDSRRQTDLENRIQIRYKGDEDDILQTVEAGNTTLSLPNTRYVGYSQSIQGLFGLKATAQVGPIDFTMITSQEKGNSVRNRYTAGSEQKSVYTRDYAYARNRIFDLGLVRDLNADTLIRFLLPSDQITRFDLFESGQADDQNGYAYSYWPERDRDRMDSVRSTFRRVDGTQTSFLIDSTTGGWYIFFQQRPTNIDSRSYAYYAEFIRDGRPDTIGDLTGDTLRLQLLSRPRITATDPLWDAEWKNVYDLGVRSLDYENLDLDIYKGQVGTETGGINIDHQGEAPYLQILGLDQTDQSGTSNQPDNKIDNNPAILDLSTGLLILPSREPFNNSVGYSVQYPDSTLNPRVPAIYNSANENDKRNASQYYFELKTRLRSTTISLGRVNILPESEVITFNGRRLTKGIDYNIDYGIGSVNFLKDDVLDPNGQLDIDYEYSPFLSVDKKTLFGLRSEYAPSPNFHTGGTFLFKGSKATDRPAQLGQEPFRDLVLDYDVFWKSSPKFLTSLANALPLVETETPSGLTLAAEVARSMPNPNTRGEVFIDDFESSRQTYSLGILREVWTIASPPLDLAAGIHRPKRGLHDPALIWYNPYTQFRITDIYDRQLENQSDNRTHVLVLKHSPSKSVLKDSVSATNPEVWTGIMRGLPQGVWDQSRSEFLELRMAVRGFGTQADLGQLHVDLGKMTEDVNLDGVWNTEDSVRNNIRNGVLDDGEDIGLDGVPDKDEVSPDGRGYDPATNPDPAGDDWAFNSEDQLNVAHINGTEGNSAEYLGGRPDSEDLGGDNDGLDLTDAYYSFSVDLANPIEALVDSSRYYDDRHNLYWNTYRIPLWGEFANAIIGAADSNRIQYARLWIDGAADSMEVYIAAVDLIQNKWLGGVLSASDSTDTDTIAGPLSRWGVAMNSASVAGRELPEFRVAVKNTETDNDYNPPPGVKGYKAPGTTAREKEQSLSLEYEKFIPGDTGRALLDSRTNQDYTGYRNLSMFVHGPETADGATLFYLRFGQDSLNYYFYQDTIRTGPGDRAWTDNDVTIDFDQLTAFKEAVRLNYLVQNPQPATIDTLDETTHFGVHGLPSLQFVSYMEVGLIRTDARGDDPHSGQAWLDELRLTDVRKDKGTAGRVAMTAQIADFINVGASLEGQNYAFRSLTAGRTGSVVNSSSQLNQDYSGSIALEKFFPQSLGLSLPVRLNYSKRTSTPQLLTGSDVVLSKELQGPHIAENVTQGFSTSIRLSPRDAGWLFRSTIGGLTGSFAANKTMSHSYTVPGDTSIQYTAQASYSVSLNKRLSFPALFWTRFLVLPKRIWGTQFSLLPNDFSAGGAVFRSDQRHVNSDKLRTTSYLRTLNGTARTSYSPIPAMRFNYNMTTKRDIARPEEVKLSFSPSEFKLGREQQFNQRFDGAYKPTIFSWLAPSFSVSTDFNDKIDDVYRNHDIDRNRRMSVSGTLDPDKFWDFFKGQGSRKKRPGQSQAPSQYGPSRRKLMEEQEKEKRGQDKQDSTVAPAPQASSGGGMGPMDLWRGLISGFSLLTSPIEPLSITLSRSNVESKSNLVDRPRLAYLFGVSDTIYAATSEGSQTYSNVDAVSQSDAISIKNDIKVFRFLTLNSNYALATSERHQKQSDNWSKSVTFPSLSTSFGQIEKIIPLRWIFVSATAKTGYSAKVDSSWAGSRDVTPTSVVKTTGFSPLLSLTGNTKRGIRLNYSMDRTTSTSEPDHGTRQRRTTSSWRLTLDYTFRSPNGLPLPFLRGIRLNSQMAVSLAISGRSSNNESANGDSPYQHVNSSSEFAVSPKANYSFSARVKGGFSAQWTDSKDDSSGPRKSHIRELGIWVEFSF